MPELLFPLLKTLSSSCDPKSHLHVLSNHILSTEKNKKSLETLENDENYVDALSTCCQSIKHGYSDFDDPQAYKATSEYKRLLALVKELSETKIKEILIERLPIDVLSESGAVGTTFRRKLIKGTSYTLNDNRHVSRSLEKKKHTHNHNNNI